MPQIEGREREYDDTEIQYPWQQPQNPTPVTVPPPATTTPPPPPAPTDSRGDRNNRPGDAPDGWEWYWNEAPNGVGQWTLRRIAGENPIQPSDGGGFDVGGSWLPENWAWPSYQAPDYLDPGAFDPGPGFDPGPAFNYREFVAPTGESMLNEPGFQFRMDQGRKALESSAAGRGVLRSGGTLKDILGYGQNFASQEYGNVFNRATQEYDRNRENAFQGWQSAYGGRRDAFDRNYGQRKDAYSFLADNTGRQNIFNQGNSQFGFGHRQRQAELEFRDAFDRWVAEGNWNRDIIVGGSD